MSHYDPPTDSSEPFDYDDGSGRSRPFAEIPDTCCWCAGPRGDDYTPLKRDGRWYAICRPCRETREAQAELQLAADSAMRHERAMEVA